jgi:hypothetical protein
MATKRSNKMNLPDLERLFARTYIRHCSQMQPRRSTFAQRIKNSKIQKSLPFHGLDFICYLERSFRLRFDLVHCNTVRQFDQC